MCLDALDDAVAAAYGGSTKDTDGNYLTGVPRRRYRNHGPARRGTRQTNIDQSPNAPTTMALASWGRWPVSAGEQPTGCGCGPAATSLVPWIPAEKGGIDEGSTTDR